MHPVGRVEQIVAQRIEATDLNGLGADSPARLASNHGFVGYWEKRTGGQILRNMDLSSLIGVSKGEMETAVISIAARKLIQSGEWTRKGFKRDHPSLITMFANIGG